MTLNFDLLTSIWSTSYTMTR